MIRTAFLILAIALGVAATSTAQAGQLVTSVLTANSGLDDDYVCTTLNTGRKEITVFVEIFNASTGVAIRSSERTIAVGEASSVIETDTNVSTAYCKVSGKFSKKKVKLTFCVRPDGTNDCKALAFEP
jgi:hypothetical protein